MVTKTEIQRINELARKSKAGGLTEAEKKEQQALRRKYIDSFKANLRAELDRIEIVDPEKRPDVFASKEAIVEDSGSEEEKVFKIEE